MVLLQIDSAIILSVNGLFALLIALVGLYTLYYSLRSKKNEHWLAFGVVALVIAYYVVT